MEAQLQRRRVTGLFASRIGGILFSRGRNETQFGGGQFSDGLSAWSGRVSFVSRFVGGRSIRIAMLLLALVATTGAGPRTRNFIVRAEDPQFAAEVAAAAERYRDELALKWLGHKLPAWPEPIPIHVGIEPQAHGATSFLFSGPGGESGIPYQFRMEVYGTHERILDSVLPHEITHTIFATHFQSRLPRWLDEGASSSIEHHSEIRKQEHNLLVFLSSGKGIPFNQMFRMMEYPRDMLPLYAQGFSVVRFLLELDSEAGFTRFVETGLQTRDWDEAVRRHYGFADLSELQLTWNDWVREGSPDFKGEPRLASRFNPLHDSASASTSATASAVSGSMASPVRVKQAGLSEAAGSGSIESGQGLFDNSIYLRGGLESEGRASNSTERIELTPPSSGESRPIRVIGGSSATIWR